MGPLNQWPRGLILALSSGPSVDLTVYRISTLAGTPHRAALPLPMYAGQSRNNFWLRITAPPDAPAGVKVLSGMRSNRPDQCFGCTGAASSPKNGKIAGAGPDRAARPDLGLLP
jgi:hypothetical protein